MTHFHWPILIVDVDDINSSAFGRLALSYDGWTRSDRNRDIIVSSARCAVGLSDCVDIYEILFSTYGALVNLALMSLRCATDMTIMHPVPISSAHLFRQFPLAMFSRSFISLNLQPYWLNRCLPIIHHSWLF